MGKRMKIYFAGGENNHWQKAFLKKDIFLDSGGYSAFTKGIEINLDEYIGFIKENKKYINTYAVLDVIGSHEKTMKNQRYMESKGLRPLPVFHYEDNFKHLKKLTKEYNYIALGGMVPIARNKLKLFNFLDNCFKIIGKKKVHGFGMTGVALMKRYPFYSVDSTTWLGGSMRAVVYKFTGSDIKVLKTKNQSKATIHSISLTDNRDKRWFDRVVNNAIEWMKFEKYITDLWTKRGVVWDE